MGKISTDVIIEIRKPYLEEIERLKQKSISRRTTIRILNEKLKCRLEQVERLKQENKELREENKKLRLELKTYCQNCSEL